ncbi:cytochrome b5-like heme/steroid binding domain-containing protein [Cynara cardunculus var. scolymus]|uniref:nitrate reductase (NADH) n=1 Tax=Cynara cardunculus var. scolymus TaxID=59895 RepID=A0A124S0I8_CYNCS|nr:cytochrome b5-like heme/steroid binding domain-containing protein [Cynara cardunculus var. scolymus]
MCKQHKGEIRIVFEHPTQLENHSGGWMAREKHLEISSELAHPTLKSSVSSPFMNTASLTYTMSEVKKHNSADSALIVVHDHIYDCTNFLKDHRGGSDNILMNDGTNCSEEFDAIHSNKAKKLLTNWKKGALNVCFEGAEDLPGGGGSKYRTSLRIEMAMDPTRDIILAYMQNGEKLLPDHGYTVRMIIPGFIGGRMVKFLKLIIVTTPESENYYHFKDNRVLSSHMDAKLANSEGWCYKPQYKINELNINSMITTPCHEEILPINSWTTQRPYTLRGYAYFGGGKKVTRVKVTLDERETWNVCNMDVREKPNKYGKYWCSCFWSLKVEVLDLLGAKEIAVRALDQALNTQLDKIIWNLMGMINNCWFRVKTNMCKRHKGKIGIVFEHTTQPRNQSGGGMAREKNLEISFELAHPTLKKCVSSPFMNIASLTYTMSEVKKHNSADSAWIVVHGHIYDCTNFLKDHPSGSDNILINDGTDYTKEFDAIHSDKAKKLLTK